MRRRPWTATLKARLAEDAWNTRDPARVSSAYTSDSRWRNRPNFPGNPGAVGNVPPRLCAVPCFLPRCFCIVTGIATGSSELGMRYPGWPPGLTHY
ncbi:MAG: DUF1348 family protein [Proteobacteria bacterium]|nr:DUF1348 family protein [Pseudomonadota bacterium]